VLIRSLGIRGKREWAPKVAVVILFESNHCQFAKWLTPIAEV
jgi:hypothetical protein